MNELSLRAKYDTAMEELRKFEHFYEEYRKVLLAQDIESGPVVNNVIHFKHPSEFSARVSCLANEILHGYDSRVEEVDGDWYNIVDLNSYLANLQPFKDDDDKQGN